MPCEARPVINRNRSLCHFYDIKGGLMIASSHKIGSINTIVAYKSLLLIGAPGSGKGTQGKILGTIPGFFHIACGDVFRAVDVRSSFGRAFLEYSSKGKLVPDDVSI